MVQCIQHEKLQIKVVEQSERKEWREERDEWECEWKQRDTVREKMMGHVETGQEVNLFDASWREINYFCLLRTVFSRFNDFCKWCYFYSKTRLNDVFTKEIRKAWFHIWYTCTMIHQIDYFSTLINCNVTQCWFRSTFETEENLVKKEK